MKLLGKTAWITGASSGIGQATARLLAGEGADLVISARRDDRLQQLADEIRPLGRKVTVATADVSDRQAMQAVGELISSLGGIKAQ